MKKLIIIISVMLFISLTINAKITIKSLTGYVQTKKDSNSNWANAKAGEVLQPGFYISTGFNSTAVIQTDNAQITVKPLSQMTIASLVSTEKQKTTDVQLNYGKIEANVDTSKSKDTQTLFKVRSANTTASVRGTTFIFSDKTLEVMKGSVFFITNNGFTTIADQFEKASLNDDGSTNTPFNNLLQNHGVNTNPIGLTGDDYNILDSLGSLKLKNQAKIIIIINIID